MKAKRLPSVEHLRERFDYDPIAGVLSWKTRPREHFIKSRAWKLWNARYAETSAGYLSRKGYVLVKIDGGAYKVHRVVWKMATGEEPLEVDHKNRQRSDNKLENLRAATKEEQKWNSGLRKSNSSGRRGISWHKGVGWWTAQITVNGVRRHLGCFASVEEASAVYEVTARRLHGEFFTGG